MGKFKSKAIAALKQKLKSGSVPSGSTTLTPRQEKSIDPSMDRSIESNGINALGNSTSNRLSDTDTKGCRDCPEGMEW